MGFVCGFSGDGLSDVFGCWLGVMALLLRCTYLEDGALGRVAERTICCVSP